MRLVLAFVSMCALFARAGSVEPRPEPARRPIPVDKDWEPSCFMGEVVAVTGETITIKPKGDLKQGEITFNKDGTIKQERLYVQDNTKPARVFVFSDGMLYFNGTLPAARLPNLSVSPPVGQNKISDVLPGDLVYIGCQRFKGIDLCKSLEIHRRPGGRVPPSFGDDKKPPHLRNDVGYNAAQFVEETFVPKLLPQLLVHFGQK